MSAFAREVNIIPQYHNIATLIDFYTIQRVEIQSLHVKIVKS